MTGYIPRWFTRPQTVTHPSTNLAVYNRELNSQPVDHESDALTSTPPSHSDLWLCAVVMSLLLLLSYAQNPLDMFPRSFPDDGEVFNLLRTEDIIRTRGNTYKLIQHHCYYDLRKFNFTNRVIPVWNSLPNHVVSADTINTFKNRLDKFWSDQEVLYEITPVSYTHLTLPTKRIV